MWRGRGEEVKALFPQNSFYAREIKKKKALNEGGE